VVVPAEVLHKEGCVLDHASRGRIAPQDALGGGCNAVRVRLPGGKPGDAAFDDRHQAERRLVAATLQTENERIAIVLQS